MPDAVPLIDCSPAGDALLGEEVLFHVGLRALEGRLPAHELASRSCVLVITAPDGSRYVHPRQPGAYDGPARIASLRRREYLNDLVPELQAGRYFLRYEHAGAAAEASLVLRERSEAARLDVALELPPRVELGRERAVRVEVVVTSRADVPVRLVAPQSCWEASVVGCLESSDPPLWCRLEGPPSERRGIGEVTPIELAPGARYAVIADLGRDASVLWDDPRWAPRTAFAVTAGLLLHVVVAERARPLRLLHRVRIEYAADGTRGGPLAGPVPTWGRLTPATD